jgi:hypothetical protein
VCSDTQCLRNRELLPYVTYFARALSDSITLDSNDIDRIMSSLPSSRPPATIVFELDWDFPAFFWKAEYKCTMSEALWCTLTFTGKDNQVQAATVNLTLTTIFLNFGTCLTERFLARNLMKVSSMLLNF